MSVTKRATRKRGCFLLAGLSTIALICLFALYQSVTSRINFWPQLGSGKETTLQLPDGFEANVFAEGLNGPRFIALDPGGVLHVADRGNGRVVALPDRDSNGRADEIRVVADNLDRPHSLVYYQDAWYVGVPSGVVRLLDADGDGVAESRDIIVNDLPTSGSHRTRTVEFLPDGRMVVSVGSSCNVCDEEDVRRAAILIYDGPEGTGGRVYASGLRNAVGLTIHPETGDLWATNNGRDLMGDDLPPDTVEIVRNGRDYGWPRCHAGEIVDPDLGNVQSCEGVTQPIVQLQAHSAPLGLVFYTGQSFPAEYSNDLLVAFHGSWNRSVPTGYKVVRIPMKDDKPVGTVEDFATGWLDEETNQASGRPVGLALGPDGSLFVSDDKGGFIYRITYAGAHS